MARDLCVEIVYASPQCSISKVLRLPQGSTIADALAAAALGADLKGVDTTNLPVGIFGKVAHRGQTLKEGDRIELYRPLQEEPKLARRKRSKASKSVRT